MRYGDFTLLSSKNVDLSKMATFQRGPSRVTGEDSAVIIIFIPTGFPNLKEAVDRAIEGVPGAVALVDGVMSVRSWWFIFGEQAFVVEGTPLIDPSLVRSDNRLPSNYMVSYFDPKSQSHELKYVDKEIFESIKGYISTNNNEAINDILVKLD